MEQRRCSLYFGGNLKERRTARRRGCGSGGPLEGRGQRSQRGSVVGPSYRWRARPSESALRSMKKMRLGEEAGRPMRCSCDASVCGPLLHSHCRHLRSRPLLSPHHHRRHSSRRPLHSSGGGAAAATTPSVPPPPPAAQPDASPPRPAAGAAARLPAAQQSPLQSHLNTRRRQQNGSRD